MAILHNLCKLNAECRNDSEECFMLVQILAGNLNLRQKVIAIRAGCHKGTISRLLNGKGTCGRPLAEGLRAVLEEELSAVRLCGTCAPPLTEAERQSVALEILTVKNHSREIAHVELPEHVTAAWGEISPGDYRGIMIVLDKNVTGPQATAAIEHEVKEIIEHFRRQHGDLPDDNPPNDHRPDW